MNDNEFVHVDDVVAQLLYRIDTNKGNDAFCPGVYTGFKDLDAYTGGLQRGELILVGARPSMGKTSFALSLARNLSIRSDKCVVFFSLEQTKEQLVSRIVSTEARIDCMHILKGNLKDDEYIRLSECIDMIKGSHFLIDDTPNITADEITSRCVAYNSNSDIDLVIIDYYQLIKHVADWPDNKPDIMAELKSLARMIDAPVMVLSQVSRKTDLREDHRPQLTDFMDLFSIDQYADTILFLYRDDYYNKDSDHRGSMDVTIAKQNSGPCGLIRLSWIPEYADFKDYVRNGTCTG
ncbi:MAG: DnaB-like helicase C-terminal domain-containing protein [Butyrivibrio sp.]|nr:DnaB-like helicase C-terminal domain-containing protein [Butyrivibrio sp.]